MTDLASSRRALLRLSRVCARRRVAPGVGSRTTPIKFQLDWRFEGPGGAVPGAARPRATSRTRSSTVTVDAGNGSGGTVTRVASGSYDMGFADMAALMEFQANNPTAPNKPVGGDDGLQQHAGGGAGAEEVGHQDARPT
jgi:NitT/TauT family transport system substrate-binding protein